MCQLLVHSLSQSRLGLIWMGDSITVLLLFLLASFYSYFFTCILILCICVLSFCVINEYVCMYVGCSVLNVGSSSDVLQLL